ncbi:hypothetical protein [Bacillus norwichensis]|uniref:Uncharacterized protein n=1 Tax=Bacillus norwichensis TaxID=2762217 RepID=A0ABR8VJ52_9BACI|nr:hypothetical protein [Bacillus norwichensis]MBD8004816.1 hypothetical protein [Bacillus norwichensis]
MPRKHDVVHSNATPNSDGKYESVINDPTATQSSRLGISGDDEKRKRNPLSLSNTKNKDMEEFERFMRGDSLDKT